MSITRREFIKLGGLGGLALIAADCVSHRKSFLLDPNIWDLSKMPESLPKAFCRELTKGDVSLARFLTLATINGGGKE